MNGTDADGFPYRCDQAAVELCLARLAVGDHEGALGIVFHVAGSFISYNGITVLRICGAFEWRDFSIM